MRACANVCACVCVMYIQAIELNLPFLLKCVLRRCFIVYIYIYFKKRNETKRNTENNGNIATSNHIISIERRVCALECASMRAYDGMKFSGNGDVTLYPVSATVKSLNINWTTAMKSLFVHRVLCAMEIPFRAYEKTLKSHSLWINL